MNRPLINLIAPALAALTLACTFAAPAFSWLPALATLGAANWQVSAGGRVLPAAAASAAIVMALLWAYGVLAFLLILLAVVAVASLLRWDDAPPP